MKRIGIYGGTFNPPHVGHIRAANYAIADLCLDRLLAIPSYISPHKEIPEGSPTPEQRLQMLQLSFSNTPLVQVLDIELQRGGSSYSYETVMQLKKEYPDAELVLFMGTDMFLSFDTWRNPEKIVENASLGVFYRGQRDEIAAVARQKEIWEQKGAKVYLLENPVTEISSTDLRRMLVFDCAEEFLDSKVLQYIKKNGLYGTDRSYQNLSEAELEQTVVSLLKPSRVAHVLGCRDTAAKMAVRWGADETDARRAALLHDITKALDGPQQLTLCRAYGIILDNFSKENTKVLHALTGSLVAQRIFGENEAVVSAIRSHTTGKADMNTLEKIIYVADYMEPNRKFSGVEVLREAAYADLNKALRLGLEMTLAMLLKEGKTVSSGTQEALQWLAQNGE